MRRAWLRMSERNATEPDVSEDRRAPPPRARTRDGGPSRSVAELDRGQRGREPASESVGSAGPPEREVVRPAARRGAAGRGDSEFHPRMLDIDEAPRSPIRWLVVLTLAALLACAATWASLSRIASYASATGKVQATGRTKVVEALAIGKVARILVRDGDTVKAGAVLVEFDPTAALSARTILDQKLIDLRAQTQRLRMEIEAARAERIVPDTAVGWSGDVPEAVRAREAGVARADLMKLAAEVETLVGRRHAKEAERDRYAASIEAQKALVATTQENLTMVETLSKSGFNSEAKYLDARTQLEDQRVTQTAYEGSLGRAEQAILVISSQIAKARQVFVATATQAVSSDEQASLDLAQQLVKADDTLRDMVLTAPVAGIVHASAVTTVGQVAKPRQQMMQIVPSDAPIEIQAYISNTDIGFIREGDPATVKITAFDYRAYGSIDGTVTHVASDRLPLQGRATVQPSSLDGEYRPTTEAQKTGNIQFPITVRLARTTITVQGDDIPLVPGMGVNVEILTENRRAIDYIVAPIQELFSTAAHERS